MQALQLSFNGNLRHRYKRPGRQCVDRVTAFNTDQAQQTARDRTGEVQVAENTQQQVTRLPIKTIIEPFRIKVRA